jgi:uncharacterized membrane protein YoaK (UPF0700 family)
VPQDEDKAAPIRNVLLTLLTIGSGAVDATTFLSAGHVFSSVITGNLVLLGIALGWHGQALSAGIALAAYAAGVAVGARRGPPRSRPDGLWPRAITVTLTVELAVLAAFSLSWEYLHARSGGWQLFLLALLAAAMGLQSSAVRRLGQVSTTYLTSTLTGLVESLVSGEGRERAPRSLVLLASITAGAAVGALAFHLDPALTPVVTAGPLAVVVAVAARRSRLRRHPAKRPARG